MLLVLCGYSATGKDTYQNMLLERNTDLRRALSATTRPIRPGETNGIEYIFTSPEWYEYKKDQILSERVYQTIQDGKPAEWKYGLLKQDFGNKDWITILDHEGAARVLAILGHSRVKIVYMVAEEEELRRRSRLRKDEPAEFNRRLEDDKVKFIGIDAIADLTVSSSGPMSVHMKNIRRISDLLIGGAENE